MMDFLKLNLSQGHRVLLDKLPILTVYARKGIRAGIDTLLEDFRSLTHIVIGVDLLFLEKHHEAITELKAACLLLFLQGGAFFIVKVLFKNKAVLEKEND